MNIYAELKVAEQHLNELRKANIAIHPSNNASLFDEDSLSEVIRDYGYYLCSASTRISHLCQDELYELFMEYHNDPIIEVNLIVPILDEADPIARFTEYFSRPQQQDELDNALKIELTIYPQIDTTLMVLAPNELVCEYFVHGQSSRMIRQTDSNTRLTYLPTGLIVDSLDRSRYRSHEAALARLSSKLYALQNNQLMHLII